ncbi:hypothetical protein EDB19DRAFT_2028798 [Suillus lakei]|nr:hypothetical protein EDB19DRAFT_2028798 [Suillus lakei]
MVIEELLVPRNPLAAWKGTNQTAAPAAVSSARKSYSALDVMLPPDTFERKRRRIDPLKASVKSKAANTYYAPNPQQYPANINLAPPRPRKPFEQNPDAWRLAPGSNHHLMIFSNLLTWTNGYRIELYHNPYLHLRHLSSHKCRIRLRTLYYI